VTPRGRSRWLGALALAALAAIGCAQGGRHGDGRWVAEAERRHALADQQLQVGNPAAAREALRGIIAERAPADLPAGDRRAVLQDTYFRLAELDLQAGDAGAALASADRGLALGRADDLFVANLLVVRGAAHETLGDSPAAVEDYHQALMINDRLLAQTLAGKPGTAPAPGATP